MGKFKWYTSQVQWHVHVVPAIQEAESGVPLESSLGNIARPTIKINEFIYIYKVIYIYNLHIIKIIY